MDETKDGYTSRAKDLSGGTREQGLDEASKVERNKDTFRRLQNDVIVNGDISIIDEIFTPDFHTIRSGMTDLMTASGLTPYPTVGDAYEKFRIGVGGMKAALSEQKREIEEIHGSGDRVWARWRIWATHSGSLLGYPPSGARVEYTEAALLHFAEDGRIDEGWFIADELNLASQIGLRLTPAGNFG